MDGVLERVSFYLIYLNSTLEAHNTSVEDSCGVDDLCKYTVLVPSSICSTQADIVVAISAANRLGVGPTSNQTVVGEHYDCEKCQSPLYTRSNEHLKL